MEEQNFYWHFLTSLCKIFGIIAILICIYIVFKISVIIHVWYITWSILLYSGFKFPNFLCVGRKNKLSMKQIIIWTTSIVYVSLHILLINRMMIVVNRRGGFEVEFVLLLPRTRIWSLPLMSGGSKLSVTPTAGHLTLSSVLLTSRVTCIHMQYSNTDSHIHIQKWK